MKQKAITLLLDKEGWQQQLASTSIVGRAVLHSEAEPGGRAWLAAVPSGRKRLEAAAFVIELRQRLGLVDASADAFCPCCEGVLDRFSLPGPAWREGNATNATTLCVTCSPHGPNVRVFALSLRSRAFCCPSVQMTLVLLTAALPTSTCHPSMELLLPLT